MRHDQERLRLDLIAVRYLEATERGDLGAIADLWAAAAGDPELEILLHELNEELAAAPVLPRRPAWKTVAAVAAAACVAALVWTAISGRGTRTNQAEPGARPVPIVSGLPTPPPGPAVNSAASSSSRVAQFAEEGEVAKLPPFTWPFADLPVLKGSSAIPADLLN